MSFMRTSTTTCHMVPAEQAQTAAASTGIFLPVTTASASPGPLSRTNFKLNLNGPAVELEHVGRVITRTSELQVETP